MASITQFKSAIGKRGGVARGNRFAVYMTPPNMSIFNLDIQGAITSALGGNFNARTLLNDPRDMSLLCDACMLPGRLINSIDDISIKQAVKIPNGFANEDVTFSFILTNDMYIKKVFDTWQQLVINTDKYRVRYQNEYTTDVIIQQLGPKDIPIYGVKLLKAWPLSVSSVPLDNSSENTAQKVTITMTFENFTTEGGLESIRSATNSAIDLLTNI